LYLSAERTGVKGRAELKGLPALEMSPDLVVEILSPSNTRRDIENKLDDYRSLGVLETWLVSSEAETIEIVQLATDEAATGAVFGVDGVLRSEALGGFSLPIREIFG
jgi:Uma2 family endonuclease